jgi:hypothetical protein
MSDYTDLKCTENKGKSPQSFSEIDVIMRTESGSSEFSK